MKLVKRFHKTFEEKSQKIKRDRSAYHFRGEEVGL